MDELSSIYCLCLFFLSFSFLHIKDSGQNLMHKPVFVRDSAAWRAECVSHGRSNKDENNPLQRRTNDVTGQEGATVSLPLVRLYSAGTEQFLWTNWGTVASIFTPYFTFSLDAPSIQRLRSVQGYDFGGWMRTGLKSSAWLFDNKMVLSVFFYIVLGATLRSTRYYETGVERVSWNKSLREEEGMRKGREKERKGGRRKSRL